MELSDIKNSLNQRNLKATKSRVQVFQTIAQFNHAIPFLELQNQLKNLDRVTLYRILLILEDKGLIHKVQLNSNESYYAICANHCTTHQHKHKHIHFKCKHCGKLYCVYPTQPFELNVANFSIDSFEIEATGACKKCIEGN